MKLKAEKTEPKTPPLLLGTPFEYFAEKFLQFYEHQPSKAFLGENDPRLALFGIKFFVGAPS